MANQFTSAQAGGGMSPVQQMIAPDLILDQNKLMRQQQMAQMLRDKAMADPEPTQVIGGYAIPHSQLAGLAKVLQGVGWQYMQNDADTKQAKLAQALSGRMQEVLGGGQPQSSPALSQAAPQSSVDPLAASASPVSTMPADQPAQGMSSPVTAQPAPQLAASPTQAPPQIQQSPSQNNFGMANLLKSSVIGQMGGDPAASAYWKQFDQTDLQKNDRYLGIGQDQSRNTELAKRLKEGYIAPTRLGEGAYADSKGNVQGLPTTAPSGFINQKDANGTWQTVPVQGGTTAVSQSAAALKAGQNEQTVAPKDMLPTNPDGTVIPRTIAQTINPPVQQTGGTVSFNGMRMDPQFLDYLKTNDPESYKAAMSVQAQPQGVGAKFGQEKGADNQQNEMSTKWTSQQGASKNAQVMNSYLQTISDLSKTAPTGKFSDRLDTINQLLSPFSEKATDQATASALIKKYHSNLIKQLGGGTDAERITDALSVPGNDMFNKAIPEAASNLMAKNNMLNSKTNLLAPHANARDAVGYTNKEIQFDQNADPRIWQLQNMDAKTQQDFVKKMNPADAADLLKKRQALKQLGVF